MSTLFGSDAVRAANVLYEQGASGVKDYMEAVDDQGAAADMAAKKLDNLAGDVDALGGSLETAFIEGGSKATGMLRFLTQTTTDVVNGFGQMGSGMQTAVVGFAAVGGGIALVGGAAIIAAPKIAAYNASMVALATTAPRAAAGIGMVTAALGPVAIALTGGAAALTIWTNRLAEGKAAADSMGDQVRTALDSTETLEGLRAKIQEVREAQQGFAEDKAGSNAPWDADYRRGLVAGMDTLGGLAAEYDALARTIELVGAETGLSKTQIEDLAAKVGVDLRGAAVDVVPALVEAYNAMDTGVSDSDRLTMSIEDQEAAMEALQERLTGLGDSYGAFTDALKAFNDVWAIAEEDAQARAQERADAENAAIDERITGLREGAQETAQALQREAEDRIRVGELSGQAAADVRRAAEDKADAIRSAADEEIDALDETKVSWEDYVDEVRVSTADLIAEWEAQVAAQQEWKANLTEVALRGRQDVAQILADMGPEGAQLAAQFADMTGEEFQRASDLFVQAMNDGGYQAGAALDEQLKIAQRLGTATARETAEDIARELGVMVDDVQLVAFSMGIALQSIWENMARARAELGATQTAAQIASGGRTDTAGLQVYANQHGGLYEFAAGGVTPAHIARGTRYKWAEPETGGEAFIPRRGERARSLGILNVAAGWHGAQVIPRTVAMAAGGFSAGIDYGRLAGAIGERGDTFHISIPGRPDDTVTARDLIREKESAQYLAGRR